MSHTDRKTCEYDYGGYFRHRVSVLHNTNTNILHVEIWEKFAGDRRYHHQYSFEVPKDVARYLFGRRVIYTPQRTASGTKYKSSRTRSPRAPRCHVCDVELTAKRNTKKYCSQNCIQQAYVQRQKERANSNRVATAAALIGVDAHAANAASARRGRKPGPRPACATCGEPCPRGRKKYCGVKCKANSLGLCTHCHSPISRIASMTELRGKMPKYCSNACKSAFYRESS